MATLTSVTAYDTELSPSNLLIPPFVDDGTCPDYNFEIVDYYVNGSTRAAGTTKDLLESTIKF